MVSSYRRIIVCIHDNFGGHPFAIWELRARTSYSTSTVRRVTDQLVYLKFLDYIERAYAGRHYKVSQKWPLSLKDAIENYELAYALGVAKNAK